VKTGCGGGFFIEKKKVTWEKGMNQSPNRTQGAPGGGGKGVGGPPPPSLEVPSGFARNDPRDYKTDRTSGVSHLKMASRQDELLEEFESFEADLQVEHILKKVKKDGIRDCLWRTIEG